MSNLWKYMMGILKMRKAGELLTRFWNDEEGSVGAEYGLLLALIALGMALAAIFLGKEIANAINRAAQCMADGTGCTLAP